MPRIFNTRLWVILLATIVFFVIGWIWYGFLFMETWMTLEGIPLEKNANGPPLTEIMGGVIISLLQALGMAAVISWTGTYGVKTGLKVGAMVWLFFAVPLMAYRWNYAEGPTQLFQIDIAHLLVGYLVLGLIYGALRKPVT